MHRMEVEVSTYRVSRRIDHPWPFVSEILGNEIINQLVHTSPPHCEAAPCRLPAWSGERRSPAPGQKRSRMRAYMWVVKCAGVRPGMPWWSRQERSTEYPAVVGVTGPVSTGALAKARLLPARNGGCSSMLSNDAKTSIPLYHFDRYGRASSKVAIGSLLFYTLCFINPGTKLEQQTRAAEHGPLLQRPLHNIQLLPQLPNHPKQLRPIDGRLGGRSHGGPNIKGRKNRPVVTVLIVATVVLAVVRSHL